MSGFAHPVDHEGVTWAYLGGHSATTPIWFLLGLGSRHSDSAEAKHRSEQHGRQKVCSSQSVSPSKSH